MLSVLRTSLELMLKSNLRYRGFLLTLYTVIRVTRFGFTDSAYHSNVVCDDQVTWRGHWIVWGKLNGDLYTREARRQRASLNQESSDVERILTCDTTWYKCSVFVVESWPAWSDVIGTFGCEARDKEHRHRQAIAVILLRGIPEASSCHCILAWMPNQTAVC
jgi:hypothetical protein